MRVDDPLREARRPGRVVELCRVVSRGVGANEIRRSRRQGFGLEHERVRRPRSVEARRVAGVGDEQLRARVREPMLDPIVAVQHGHREQDRAELPDSEEDRSRLGRRRQNDRDPVALRDTPCGERVRRLVRQVLQLAPLELSGRAVEALPNHRRLVTWVLVADVGRDVVPRRHLPAMACADLVVARRAHRYPSSLAMSWRLARLGRVPCGFARPQSPSTRLRPPLGCVESVLRSDTIPAKLDAMPPSYFVRSVFTRRRSLSAPFRSRCRSFCSRASRSKATRHLFISRAPRPG